MKSTIENLLAQAVAGLPWDTLRGDARAEPVEVQETRDAKHGDYVSNVAMRLARHTRTDARQLAESLVRALPASPAVCRVEIAGAGFINFFLSPGACDAEIGQVLAQDTHYGHSRVGGGKRMKVELVLADPTRPLHVGHGRHAAYAACVASLLQAVGFRVRRECHVDFREGADRAPDDMLRDIRVELADFGVTFDRWCSGRSSGNDGTVGRGDHPGCIVRLRDEPEAPGRGPTTVDTRRVHPVTLHRGGRKAQTAMRSGECTTLRELRTELGNDAARFFYVMRSNDQNLDIDLELAKARGNGNPVYFIQYAHARGTSVLRQLKERGLGLDARRGIASLGRLGAPEESRLMKRICDFPALVAECAAHRAPHALVYYLRDLANDFHTCHGARPFIVDDGALRDARLTLAMAARTVIGNGLGLLGVSAPDTM